MTSCSVSPFRAVKAGQHEPAVRHYTSALAASPPPLPPAAAVLHANRSAAHQVSTIPSLLTFLHESASQRRMLLVGVACHQTAL